MQSTDASPISTDAPRVPTAPRPKPPVSVFNPDPKAVASWWQHAEQFFGDAYDRPAAWNAFGQDPDGPVVPRIPGQRKPTSLSGSAA